MLLHKFNRMVYVPGLKGVISRTAVSDPIAKQLIVWSLIMKTNAGPGCLTTKEESSNFREEMIDLGMNILLSITTGTTCNADPGQYMPSLTQRVRKVPSRTPVLRYS